MPDLFAALMGPWGEKRFAVRTSRELLRLYQAATAHRSGMSRREIYRWVVMARTGTDADESDAILRAAERSFASWPADRELRFADVVHYLAVSQYLKKAHRMNTRVDMGRLVNRYIPRDL